MELELLMVIKLFILLLLSSPYPLVTSLQHNNFTDLQSLLAFKNHVVDPQHILSVSWTTNTSSCNWIGVSCSRRHQRVTAIELTSFSLSGTIPPQISNLTFLSRLDLSNNSFSGTIPESLCFLSRLSLFVLNRNHLSGSIPPNFFNMSSLKFIYFGRNNLLGPLLVKNDTFDVPPQIQELSMSVNQFAGEMPLDISRLIRITGPIPFELGQMISLNVPSLPENLLSGRIPESLGNLSNISSTLGELHMLSHIDFSSNDFHGQIPESLGGLININYINISCNSLSGAIPESLANLRHLNILDFSFNKLSGKIPGGRVFSNVSIPTLEGSLALCVISFVLLLTCLYFLMRFWKRRLVQPPTNDDIKWPNHRLISYHELVAATDNFSDANLLGTSSFGLVFKAQLNDGLLVAVKVLNLDVHGASRSFDAECHTLSAVRH
ncbi:uncharacterized protein A4U43_C04F9810 [Asparagus officinalis]|uniref:Protein kinase domain-containing protein n=1 Tax=Asparagus officinalis TaxID=4686 RepID=A0A5P1F039_ASPOF|nr:uncharacterized protein A4U43_C04F9810 [Asparagus officinalis]